ncbi:hypothetical protein EJ07DRAFT_167954 [Lizonia empirigonia]|nr:hypothetical protein EJ07DRAFT_167954 [Lizonia empirigonia]
MSNPHALSASNHHSILHHLPSPHPPLPQPPADQIKPPRPLPHPSHVTLKDGPSLATILPFPSLSQVPPPLVAFLHAQLSAEIHTYPMLDALPLASFGSYWFGVFCALDPHWETLCLGSFYIQPNYPGRSSHGFTYSVFNLVYETNVASMRIWDSLGFERIERARNVAF